MGKQVEDQFGQYHRPRLGRTAVRPADAAGRHGLDTVELFLGDVGVVGLR